MEALTVFYMSLTKFTLSPAGTRQAMEVLKMFHRRQPKLTLLPTGRRLWKL
jgi:hypothetical protein